MKIDLHVHTNYSYDSSLTLEQIIEKVKSKKLDIVAVTDHNEIKGALELQKIAPFKIIVGQEIDTDSGHILGYFLKEKIKSGQTPEKTIEEIHKQGGLVAVPHPFDKLRHGQIKKQALLRILDKIDFIEVYNARTLWPGTQRKTEKFVKKNNLIKIAGSDAHSIWELGHSMVEIKDFSDALDFKEKIKKAKFIKGHNTIWAYFLSAWTIVYKIFKKIFKNKKFPSN